MSFAVGTLVHTRGRDWVVLPDSDPELLLLRPLGGGEEEICGILPSLEDVREAHFDWPDPSAHLGDHRSAKLLRDALRLGFRSSAGPFRSFGSIAVEPRPYQLVPLLMALSLDPVRLLIADDVGVGKTVEAGLIARELLGTGEIQRLGVLCPPHLAAQWKADLARFFHIEAELVLRSTAARLERQCAVGQSVFEAFPFTVVSSDFIKSDRRRDEFIRSAPEMIIVDEAHTVAADRSNRRTSRHQRYELVRRLADDVDRHLVLVTATPHTGNEGAFRSLVGLLADDLAELPDDPDTLFSEQEKARLAEHFIQRRRANLIDYLDEETQFPLREVLAEEACQYHLSTEYHAFFTKVIEWVRDSMEAPGLDERTRRVRWWSALSLLRAVASSPRAAAATMRNRSATAAAESPEEADRIGQQTIYGDEEADTAVEMTSDVAPGANPDDGDAKLRQRLNKLADDAAALEGAADHKLARATEIVRGLLDEGFNPIVFCEFIDTAEYLGEHLAQSLGEDTKVEVVTGRYVPEERVERVNGLYEHPRRVLVATDCLAEGINLQGLFSAVIHYGLAFTPTTHEQREGRVDRFGQPRPVVRVATIFGADNRVDRIMLKVLHRRNRLIQNRTGVWIPVPFSEVAAADVLMSDLLTPEQGDLFSTSEPGVDLADELVAQWEAAADREEKSRARFAQRAIKVDEVRRELAAVREAVGSGVEVERFVRDALTAMGGTLTGGGGVGEAPLRISLAGLPADAREQLAPTVPLNSEGSFLARFEMPVGDGEVYLVRTHPFVENLAAAVTARALDGVVDSPAARAGVIRTDEVEVRTTLLVVRMRFDLKTVRGDEEYSNVVEDLQLLAFQGAPSNAEWLDSDAGESLLSCAPSGNVTEVQAHEFLGKVVDGRDTLLPELRRRTKARAEELLGSHRRVRSEAGRRHVRYLVEPHEPDVLGVYVFLPGGAP
jgi:superfamily II DNA or RNA helicase